MSAESRTSKSRYLPGYERISGFGLEQRSEDVYPRCQGQHAFASIYHSVNQGEVLDATCYKAMIYRLTQAQHFIADTRHIPTRSHSWFQTCRDASWRLHDIVLS